MDEQYYQQLVKRYLDGNATNDELEVFAHLFKTGKLDAQLKQNLNNESGIDETETVDIRNGKKTSLLPVWFKYAAAVLIFATVGITQYHHFFSVKKQVVVARLKNDALPGGNKAVLTLANGQKIILSNFANGAITKQGATRVEKVQDGLLIYQPGQKDSTNAPLTYNTINTPKGGQYQVTLPDGSNVWLNAVSSITFPTVFSGNERVVTVTGEVYFEVIKNKNKPFIVKAPGQTVQVLGTHFNINAYADEHITRTTLLEGGIKISTNQFTKVITPGQQAQVTGQYINIINDSDTETAVAWKNGNFVFNNTSLPALMRQLGRWYDVNIIYDGAISNHEFVGQIKRDVKLSSVLKF